MKLLLVMFAWLVMALLLIGGVVMAVLGSFWLLALGVAGFVLAIAKIGCLSH